ncbi:FAD-dependent monooxygenase [Thiobacter aerophilum]|uniref:FAD-dependent monooxygenase n=1 Tax=Thiobacter aerophilum TaxID=3121275 RepID=A0ABV0EF46_9BURK
MRPDGDILIVGGGPVGATLALALARGMDPAAPLSITVLEARRDLGSLADARTLALSHGSRLILEQIGIWPRLPDPTPITRIHVSQRASFGRTLLTAREAGLPALGYVIDYAALLAAFDGALREAQLSYLTGAEVERVEPHAVTPRVVWRGEVGERMETARLMVLADGGRLVGTLPGVRQIRRDYGQWAVVGQVRSERPHDGLAYERFTPDGPAALLPYRDRFALVWTASPETAQTILSWDDPTFLARLNAHFGDRQGRFLWASPRAAFPLGLRRSEPRVLARTVLVGNAAQTLHPVAGQGFNLGLRDAFELAGRILATPRPALGGDAMLKAYARGRRLDTGGAMFFTDWLVRGFSNDVPVLREVRAAALSLLDIVPPAKDFVVRRMIFGARG